MSKFVGSFGISDRDVIENMLNKESVSNSQISIFDDFSLGIINSTDHCELVVDDVNNNVVVFMGALNNVDNSSLGRIILDLYITKGIKIASKMGHFCSFILIDQNNSSLHLVRDNFGFFNIYYYIFDKVIYFSSRLGSLLKLSFLPIQFDEKMLKHYLPLGYPIFNETGFKNVNKVKPGSYLSFSDKIIMREYWSLDQLSPLPTSQHHIEQTLFRKLLHSIKLYFEDKPKKSNIMISGGLDSSTIAALCSKKLDVDLTGYCVGYDTEYYSELKRAKEIADHLNMNFVPKLIQFDDIDDVFVKSLIPIYEEPYANSSSLGLNALISEIKTNHPILTGDGGDEALLGYTPYYWKEPKLLELFSQFPEYLKNAISKGVKGPLNLINQSLNNREMQKISLYLSSKHMRDFDPAIRFTSRFPIAYFQIDEIDALVQSGLSQMDYMDLHNFSREYFYKIKEDNKVVRNNLLYIKMQLLADIMKMKKPVEVKEMQSFSPFLNTNLFEYCLRIPSNLKIQRGYSKYLLRKIAFDNNLLPKNIVYNSNKKGFEFPIEHIIKHSLCDLVDEVLLKSELSKKLLNADYIRKLMTKSDRYSSMKIWNLLMLGLWGDHYKIY